MVRKSKRKQRMQQQAGFMTVLILVGFILTLMVLVRPTTPSPPPSGDEQALRRHFFETILPAAQENQRRYGILTSVTLAQSALESDFGKSELSAKYYNLFGVKGTAQNGVLMPTLEFVNGQWIQVQAYFKVYANWGESVLEHGALMANGTTWNNQLYHQVLRANSYQQAAQALVQAGYATDPNYAQKLIQMIEQYQLYQYD